MTTNWGIIVVVAVIKAYESSVAAAAVKKRPELGPVPGHENRGHVALSLTHASDASG